MMYRQGDVLLVPLPETDYHFMKRNRAIAPSNGHIVLLGGEATGHAHVLPANRVEAWLYRGGISDSMIIKVSKVAPLTHEEHDTIKIPPGVYRRVRQREYTGSSRPLYKGHSIHEVRYVRD